MLITQTLSFPVVVTTVRHGELLDLHSGVFLNLVCILVPMSQSFRAHHLRSPRGTGLGFGLCLLGLGMASRSPLWGRDGNSILLYPLSSLSVCLGPQERERSQITTTKNNNSGSNLIFHNMLQIFLIKKIITLLEFLAIVL